MCLKVVDTRRFDGRHFLSKRDKIGDDALETDARSFPGNPDHTVAKRRKRKCALTSTGLLIKEWSNYKIGHILSPLARGL